MSLTTVASQQDFESKVKSAAGFIVASFIASWHQPCQQVSQVLTTLAAEHTKVQFLVIDVEDVPEVAEQFNVEAVPTFVVIREGSAIVGRQTGADIPALVSLVESKTKASANVPAQLESKAQAQSPATGEQDLNARLSKLVRAAPVMLFMKGSPSAPQCGFSRTIVGLLNEQQVVFSSFDILTDNAVRQGLKSFSNWKTYPQLYIGGELVGGLDVVRELIEEDELKDMIPEAPKAEDLNAKLKRLINKHRVVIFMKGSPDTPKCGFSRTAIGLLSSTGAEFDHFDILLDNDVRQGLKRYSNWPTYPQLYVAGELMGGLDVMREMNEDGELAELLTGSN